MLINNAGVMPVGPFLQQSDQAIRSAIEVNFYGVLNGCRLVLPEMVARRGGHIVNIASLAGMIAVPGQAVYAGTKFAVVGLSDRAGRRVRSTGREVSAVLPTFTNTELIAGTHPSAAQKPVQPEDIAAAVVKVLDKPTTVVSVPRRCGSSPRDTAARSRAGGAGCSRSWAPTGCSWISTLPRGSPTRTGRSTRSASPDDTRRRVVQSPST